MKIKQKLIYPCALLLLFAGSASTCHAAGFLKYNTNGLDVILESDMLDVSLTAKQPGLGNCPDMFWSITIDAGTWIDPVYWSKTATGLVGCNNNSVFGSLLGAEFNLSLNSATGSGLALINDGYNHYSKFHTDAPKSHPPGLFPPDLFWKADVEWWYPDIARGPDSKPGKYKCNVTVNVYYTLYNNVGDNPGKMGTVSGEAGHSNRMDLSSCTRMN
ncbi:TPA: hypothetical protein N3A33_004936 [Salmonella enterica subsp. salamae serovar 28:r:e,n,z15]|nr:hypothetical protein [Salmonella enterica subsp. salamae serovar 28:r:e,n,z15]